MTNTNTKNNKHYKKYKQLLNDAFSLRTKSELLLTYNDVGNMSDLDLSVMETMTKQQIIDRLYKYEKD